MSMSRGGPATHLLIGELSERTGASRRSLRYYEDQGLLHARRGDNGYRYYDADAVDRVHRIKRLLAMGLPVKAVRTILPCVIDRDLAAVACRELRETLGNELRRLESVALEVDRSRQLIASVLDRAERRREPEPAAP